LTNCCFENKNLSQQQPQYAYRPRCLINTRYSDAIVYNRVATLRMTIPMMSLKHYITL